MGDPEGILPRAESVSNPTAAAKVMGTAKTYTQRGCYILMLLTAWEGIPPLAQVLCAKHPDPAARFYSQVNHTEPGLVMKMQAPHLNQRRHLGQALLGIGMAPILLSVCQRGQRMGGRGLQWGLISCSAPTG